MDTSDQAFGDAQQHNGFQAGPVPVQPRFCSACGKELTAGVKFCGNCGTPILTPRLEAQDDDSQTVAFKSMPGPMPAVESGSAPTSEQVFEGSPAPDSIQQPAQPPIQQPEQQPVPASYSEQVQPAVPQDSLPSKAKAKPRRIVIAIILLIVIAVGAVFGFMEWSRSSDYEKATRYYDVGQYESAAAMFEQLGDYEDSAAMLDKARLWLEAEKIENAAGTDPDAFTAAAEAYEKIGKEASDEAEECRNASIYYTAVKQADAGEWEQAFNTLGGLGLSTYGDSDSLMDECYSHVEYAKAERLYEKGKYYDAYAAFSSLSDRNYKGVSDAGERAQQCIQTAPEAGVVERGSHQGGDSTLVIHNSDNEAVYYKLYIGDEFVLSVYVPGKGSASFDLASGTYHMNKAYGTTWFGPNDIFGDEGDYYHCMFGESKTVEIESNYEYEISSGQVTSDSEGISVEAIDRDSF